MKKKAEPVTYVDHISSLDCWCHPDVIFEWEDRVVVVHKGHGEELATPKEIVRGIADAIANRTKDEKDG